MMDVGRLLQSTGHRCFRNCSETALRRGEELNETDLLRCDPAFWGSKPSGQRPAHRGELHKEGTYIR